MSTSLIKNSERHERLLEGVGMVRIRHDLVWSFMANTNTRIHSDGTGNDYLPKASPSISYRGPSPLLFPSTYCSIERKTLPLVNSQNPSQHRRPFLPKQSKT